MRRAKRSGSFAAKAYERGMLTGYGQLEIKKPDTAVVRHPASIVLSADETQLFGSDFES
jgi:hypothetical protein